MAGETMMHNLVSLVVCLYGVSQMTLAVGGTLWERFGCAAGTLGVLGAGAASAFHPVVTRMSDAAWCLLAPDEADHSVSLERTGLPPASCLLGLLQPAWA